MKRHIALPLGALACAPLAYAFVAPQPVGGDELELDEAEVFIEFNSTDGDFGLQVFFDGEAWDKMAIFAPGDQPALRIQAARNLALQGLTEGFFESREPSPEKLSMEEFLERFPEGEYEFEGFTIEGAELEGETEFTHSIPSPPAGLFPAEGSVVPANTALLAGFDAVTQDLHGADLEPLLYEIVVEAEEEELTRIFSVTLDGSAEQPQVTLPPEFLTPGGEYKLEIIVQEPSGNRTITEALFFTEGDDQG